MIIENDDVQSLKIELRTARDKLKAIGDILTLKKPPGGKRLTDGDYAWSIEYAMIANLQDAFLHYVETHGPTEWREEKK